MDVCVFISFTVYTFIGFVFLFFAGGGTFESRTNIEISNLLSLWTEAFSQLIGLCSY